MPAMMALSITVNLHLYVKGQFLQSPSFLILHNQGLRLHDNPALRDACTGSAAVFPIFIIDPYFLQKSNN
eukprot:scaffold225747_cov18-Tisochrysis_lutea.AAC.2